MPTPTKGARLGGSAAHERLILANLATQLFEHGRITTTEAKAKRLRPLAEKLITKAKRGDLHARRQVATTVRDKGVVHALFTEIAPTFADREGGYTRITKVGLRKGDRAPMAVIELVTETVEESRRAAGRPVDGADAAKHAGSKSRRLRPASAKHAAGDSEEATEEATEVEATEDVTEVEATEGTESAESAASAESPESPESAESADSPDSPDSPDTPAEPEQKPEA